MSVVEIALTAEQLSDEERRSFLEAACADRLRGRLQAFPHQARLDEGIDGISDGAPKGPCFEGLPWSS
ncbi:MAG: hypothetical protein DMG08_01060 [Acidobacteria bacterium]|nr:MAG: hypothetical protein DMG08_01060 [Acidobacteriota bacterium]PYV31725.1 MAG: hypothetical protein DMG09_25535 [Acidobacteriota bacterium]